VLPPNAEVHLHASQIKRPRQRAPSSDRLTRATLRQATRHTAADGQSSWGGRTIDSACLLARSFGGVHWRELRSALRSRA
jgi:hypothetical protein